MSNPTSSALTSINKALTVYRVTEDTSGSIKVNVSSVESVLAGIKELQESNKYLAIENGILKRKLDDNLIVNTSAGLVTLGKDAERKDGFIEQVINYKFSIKLGAFDKDLKAKLIELLEFSIVNNINRDRNSDWGDVIYTTNARLINYEIVENDGKLDVYCLIQLNSETCPHDEDEFSLKLIGTNVVEIETGKVTDVNFNSITISLKKKEIEDSDD